MTATRIRLIAMLVFMVVFTGCSRRTQVTSAARSKLAGTPTPAAPVSPKEFALAAAGQRYLTQMVKPADGIPADCGWGWADVMVLSPRSQGDVCRSPERGVAWAYEQPSKKLLAICTVVGGEVLGTVVVYDYPNLGPSGRCVGAGGTMTARLNGSQQNCDPEDKQCLSQQIDSGAVAVLCRTDVRGKTSCAYLWRPVDFETEAWGAPAQ